MIPGQRGQTYNDRSADGNQFEREVADHLLNLGARRNWARFRKSFSVLPRQLTSPKSTVYAHLGQLDD
jgi:hypothetical protein